MSEFELSDTGSLLVHALCFSARELKLKQVDGIPGFNALVNELKPLVSETTKISDLLYKIGVCDETGNVTPEFASYFGHSIAPLDLWSELQIYEWNLVRAIFFATDMHKNQRRKDADRGPYINHPLSVMRTLLICGVKDPIVLAGAVLHDTVEDTEATKEDIAAHFGDSVATVVMECTDDKDLGKIQRKQLQIEHAAHISSRGKLVKLSDKYDNISTLADAPPADWSPEVVLGYARWGFSVCANLYGVNAALDALMQSTFQQLGVTSVSPEELEAYYEHLRAKEKSRGSK